MFSSRAVRTAGALGRRWYLAAVVAVVVFVALAGAGRAAAAASNEQWQVGFSFNCDNKTACPSTGGLGGFWGWYAFNSDGTGDAALTFCGHGPPGSGGAGHENVQILDWTIGGNGDFVIVSSSPADAEGDTGIPAAPGHYSLHPAPGISGNVQVSLNPTG